MHSVDEKGQHQSRREDDQARVGNLLLEPAPAFAGLSSLIVAALILGPEIILRSCCCFDLLHFLVRRVTEDEQSR